MSLLSRSTALAPCSARASASSRVLAVPQRLPTSARRGVVARANTTEDDPAAKFQEQVNKSVDWVKARWEETSDEEKPAAVAIIIGVTVAQIAIGATVDAVDRIPFVHQFLELVGLAVVGVYGWRYVTDPTERDSVKKSIENFVSAVTGKQERVGR